MQGRAKVHEKQANRRRSEKLGAAQSVHAWSRSRAYTYPQCSVLCARSSKSSKLHRTEKNALLPGCTCARRAFYTAPAVCRGTCCCRNVAANRRVLVHLCKIIEACKCKQRFSVRCLYALRSAQNFRQEEVRVHQTAVPR